MQATSALDLASSLHWKQKQKMKYYIQGQTQILGGPERSALRKEYKIQYKSWVFI